MGRKIVGALLGLLAALLILYNQRPLFAQEEEMEVTDPSEGEEEEVPEPLPVCYEVLCEEPDGEMQYYISRPDIKVRHIGEGSRTHIQLIAEGGESWERVLTEAGEEINLKEQLREGKNTLQVWMEGEEPLHCEKLEILLDTMAPALEADVRGGAGNWHQNEAVLEAVYTDPPQGSGVKKIACYVNGAEIPEEEKGVFRIREASVGGEAVRVRLEVLDLAGNRAVWEEPLYIDKTAPGITVDNAADYLITSRDVEMMLTAQDDNGIQSAQAEVVWTSPDGEKKRTEEQWTDTGDGRRLKCRLQQDGIYQVKVTVADLAGFTAQERLQIIIDKTNPVIRKVDTLRGAQLREFCWEEPIEELIQDFTSVTYTVCLDGLPYLPGQVIREEERHRLTVRAEDAAGNQSAAEAEFVIDRTRPEILFTDAEDGRAYEEKEFCTVKLADAQDWFETIEINGRQEKLTGKQSMFVCKVQEYGMYQIEAAARDAAGNRSRRKILIEVVPKESMLEEALVPVKRKLGIETRTFEKTEEKAGREETRSRSEAAAVCGVGICLAAVLAAGRIHNRKRKNIP